jgi:hypothetical protein
MQKGVGEKAVNQLEKVVTSKLEGAVTRQIHSQFQTSGKQALQVIASKHRSVVSIFNCNVVKKRKGATYVHRKYRKASSIHYSYHVSLPDPSYIPHS